MSYGYTKRTFFFENASRDLFSQALENWFRLEEIQTQLFSVKSENSRKVIHYGYAYDYTSGGTRKEAPEFPMIIDILKKTIPRVWEDAPDGIVDRLNQCIINRYFPGQGIGHHIDRPEYGAVIVCFTFLSGREMEFTRNGESYKIYTPPRSMYVMTGESRDEWEHQMRPRKSDGKSRPRGECFSVTFREVPE